MRLIASSAFLSVASCIAPAHGPALDLVAGAAPAASVSAPAAPAQEPPAPRRRPGFEWQPGQPLLQGFIGVSELTDVSVDDDGPGRVDGDEGDLDQLPVLGGGGQWKLGGRRVDLGLEGLFSAGWRSNAEAFVVGGGGAVVAIDVDLLLLDLYGGPFASVFLGDRLRLYAATGPLLQWANYDQTGNGQNDDGSGFGYGYYARTGIEFAFPSRTLVGLGVRWSDSEADLGGSLGDLEIEGLQFLLTVSRGL